MKRIIFIGVLVVLAMSFAGCSANDTSERCGNRHGGYRGHHRDFHYEDAES